MKVTDYLENKRALLTRGHHHDCACNVCMEFLEAIYEAKGNELVLEVTSENKEKAAKWDIIQWAINNGIEFIETDQENTYITVGDLELLEKLYKESETE